MRAIFLTSLYAFLLAVSHAQTVPGQWRAASPQPLTGLCDASAVIPVSSNLFLIATDEDNVLRLYRLPGGPAPVQSFDLTTFLELDKKGPEADLEAAALAGKRAFWIGSHGLNKDGSPRPNRARFFATDMEFANGKLAVTPVGRPCKTLLKQMIADSRIASFGLADAARIRPKDEDGLNIEGLAVAPDGGLLIGFRNPIPEGKALVVPLKNPNEVVQGATAEFGVPLLLDLGGLGVRDMAPAGTGFYVLAGPYKSGGPHRLGHWTGAGAEVAFSSLSFDGLNPEAVVPVPGNSRGRLLILSDDGAVKVGKRECKQMKNPAQRSFRALFLDGR